jgi:hypothetical protein
MMRLQASWLLGWPEVVTVYGVTRTATKALATQAGCMLAGQMNLTARHMFAATDTSTAAFRI